MHILLPTLRFPPFGSAGALRLNRFVRHFAELGGRVTVVTASLDDLDAGYPRREILDQSLLESVPSGIRIVRTGSVVPKSGSVFGSDHVPSSVRLKGWPDNGVHWNRVAEPLCESILRQDKIDCIYTSSNPVSGHLLGRDLAGRFGVPWVCEFRDPWTSNPFRTWASKREFEAERVLEAGILSDATRIIMNTPTARRGLLKGFPSIADVKVDVVNNSFPRTERTVASRQRLPADPLVIAHVGTMSGVLPVGERSRRSWRLQIRRVLRNRRLYQIADVNKLGNSPWYVCEALKELIAQEPSFREKVRFVMVGRLPSEESVSRLQRYILSSGLDGVVEYRGVVPYIEAVRVMEEADVLLVNQQYTLDGARCAYVPAKLYEYLAAGRRILGLLPPGDALDFVVASGVGTVVPPDDPVRIATAIRELYENRLNSIDDQLRPEFVAQFRSDVLASRLWGIFNDVVNCRSSAERMEPALHG